MGFKAAVESTESIRNAYRKGLQALPPVDAKRIRCNKPRNLTGSVNLDKALGQAYPNDPIWDYGIGYRKRRSHELAIWIEVHAATPDRVKEMERKLHWLKTWLKEKAPALRAVAGKAPRFIWISSGRVALLKNSPEARRLAKTGIAYPCRELNLDQCYR